MPVFCRWSGLPYRPVDHDDVSQAAASDLDRLTAYTYLTVPDRRTYLAIMRVFTATLLADLSAHDVAERLPGSPLPDTVAAKLDNLKTWGNLLPSSRPVRRAASANNTGARPRSSAPRSPSGSSARRTRCWRPPTPRAR